MKSLAPTTHAYLLGLIGVASFSLTFPMTRRAVAELDPVFVGLGRAVVAAVLALLVLAWQRAPAPSSTQITRLVLVALGVIVGFPLLSAWAMQSADSSHGAVVAALLPLATAAGGALRAGERPSAQWWAFALAGSALVLGNALHRGAGSISHADLALVGAMLAAAVGYTEGAMLAREMPPERVICWALVLAAPALVLVLALWPMRWPAASPAAWGAFAYVSVVSMFLGFFAWYRGLALGGIARVAQVQLLQPFLTLLAAAFWFGESVAPQMWLFAAGVVACVALGRRAPIAASPALAGQGTTNKR
ncbi:DMT family transporter [Niveibacterium sp. 24ML]|uniref:DMT family transporter n=1 Tax=Niveibacterium sp. 24ML TaxID=2985512 RepID=UPI0022716E58|nr:DMT family transporter [Niveibacterium sp. 24ML]MCX9157574.1 DMT family transporter [Niveibacterium sp. 24ML]